MQECHYDEKKDQGYDTSDIRVCKCRNVIMMINDPGYDTSGIRVCKCKKSIMKKQITKIMIPVGLEFVNVKM